MPEVQLLPYQSSFLDPFIAWRNEPLSVQHNPLKDMSREAIAAMLESEGSSLADLTKFGSYRWFVEVKNQVVGSVSLKNISHSMGYAEIGYGIAEEHHGKGIATAAVRLLVKRIFLETSLRKLTAFVHDKNRASQRVLEKLGFRQEGRLREHYIIRGQPVDEIFYGLLKQNWSRSNNLSSARYTLGSDFPAQEKPMASSAVSYAQQNQQRFLGELKDLLRIPSVSTAPEHKDDVRRAAEFVAGEMRRIGLENVEVIATKGHPLIYADWLHAEGKPTVLCYAHYDVQPAEPLNEWISPPFEPTERNQNIYARGAVDDKGQLWMEIKAIEALMRGHSGRLPLNVKFIIEGEEEVGGESIAAYVRKEKSKLKADFALVCDTELFAPDLPTLCVGLRGLIYSEIEAQGARTDLHSGMYGGAAPNPLFALIEIISKLKDAKGRILIPGFYKNVKAPSKDELKAWKRLPFHEEHYRKTEVGSKVLTGEPGYSVLYRTWARPTLEVHGIPGGFTAAGAKTVIPARASAKVSMRLVPDQDPEDIFKRYTKFVKKLTPKGIELNIKVHSKGPACVVRTDNRYVEAATEAMHDVFKKPTVFIRSGGSIPIVTDFQDVLKIPSVMMGFGLPDDNLHAPNEKFHIPNFYRGIESIIRFFEKLGA